MQQHSCSISHSSDKFGFKKCMLVLVFNYRYDLYYVITFAFISDEVFQLCFKLILSNN